MQLKHNANNNNDILSADENPTDFDLKCAIGKEFHFLNFFSFSLSTIEKFFAFFFLFHFQQHQLFLFWLTEIISLYHWFVIDIDWIYSAIARISFFCIRFSPIKYQKLCSFCLALVLSIVPPPTNYTFFVFTNLSLSIGLWNSWHHLLRGLIFIIIIIIALILSFLTAMATFHCHN